MDMDINIEAACRVCLKNCAVSDIFLTQKFHAEKQTPYYEMMTTMFSLPVVAGDGLPSKICQKCSSKLTSAYKLKILAEHSYQQLSAYFAKVRIKDSSLEKEDVKDELKTDVKIKDEMADSLLQCCLLEVKKEEDGDEGLEPGAGDSDYYDEDDNLPLVFARHVGKHAPPKANKRKYKVDRTKCREKKSPAGICEICGKSVRDLAQHRRSHDPNRPRLPCNICPRSFLTHSALSAHRAGNHLGKLYYCTICDKSYKRGWEHRQRHTERPRPHACAQCHRRFPTAAQLSLHTATHTAERAFPCSQCGKCFQTKSSQDMHRRRVHEHEKKNICQYCFKGFFSRHHLKVHLRSHTKEKKYECKECGKSFATPSCLNMHAMRHAGIKKANCSVCHKGFINQGALTAHMVSHTKQKVHPCKYCGVMFGRTDHRNRHQKTAHQTEPRL